MQDLGDQLRERISTIPSRVQHYWALTYRVEYL